MTRPITEERERILADAEWVIAHYDDSTRAVRIARALLSTSSAERGMREALEEVRDWINYELDIPTPRATTMLGVVLAALSSKGEG